MEGLGGREFGSDSDQTNIWNDGMMPHVVTYFPNKKHRET